MKKEGMTKLDAEALEALCERRIGDALGAKATVSMSLNGCLKIDVGDNSINFSMPCMNAEWVRFQGDYCDLIKMRDSIVSVVRGDMELFDLLIWSYHNKRNLT